MTRRPDLKLELLRAFVAVAEQRSFTRAAAGLHRSQSAVSLQIGRLERQLGVVLFDRAAQGVEMTDAGRKLLGFATGLLALSERAVSEVAGRPGAERVRLGVMEDFGVQVASRLIADFGREHPDASIEVHSGLTTPMVDRLGHDLDLVIAMHPAGDGSGHLLQREQAVWAVGPRFRAESESALPLALYAPGCLLREWAIAALDGARRRWSLKFVGQNIASVHAAASEGQALTVVKASMFPRTLRRAPRQLGLPRLPAADVRLHRAGTLSPTARSFADHLVNRLPACAS